MTFLKGSSAQGVAEETGIERKRVLRALLHVREAMVQDISDVFSGMVEIDETYIGGQWQNKRKSQKAIKTKRGRGTQITPVFGIRCRSGKVRAEVVADPEAKTLLSLISQRVKRGTYSALISERVTRELLSESMATGSVSMERKNIVMVKAIT